MKQYTVKSGQNLYDVAITLHGTVEGIFDLIISNQGIGMDTILQPGDVLNYNENFLINSDITNWVAQNDLTIKNGHHDCGLSDVETMVQALFKKKYPDIYETTKNMSVDEKSEFWKTYTVPRMIIRQRGITSTFSFKLKPETKLIVDWGDYSEFQIWQSNSGNAYNSIKKLHEYLYLVNYNDIDYAYAKEYFYNTVLEIPPFACSSLRNGNWFGRNLDWFYNRCVDFVVRTPHINGRNASVGIGGTLSGLTDSFVALGNYSELYKILPFYMLDGINEHGLFANTNVVPTDKGITTVTIPQITERERICTTMLVRYILDKFSEAEEAIQYIKNYVALYPSATLQNLGYEAHFMIGDKNKTYVMEIVGNVIKAVEHDKMTNFYIDGVEFNSDGEVYTPIDIIHGYIPSKENGITPYGSGLERYNIIVDQFAYGNTKVGMRHILDLLMYSNAYKQETSPFWYTEFVNDADKITIDTPTFDEKLRSFVAKAIEQFKNRSRDENVIWHTSHSCIYDIGRCRLYVCPQEEIGTEFAFGIRQNEEPPYVTVEHTYKGQGEHQIMLYGDFNFESLDLSNVGGVYYPLSKIIANNFTTKIYSEDINHLIERG